MVAGGSQTQWGTTNANCIGVTSLRHQWPQIPAPSQCYQACPTPLSNSLRPPQWHLLWQVTTAFRAGLALRGREGTW